MARKSTDKVEANTIKWLRFAASCLVTASGLVILKHSHIVTGGTAGLSLSISPLLHVQFHYLFILLNLPFFVFSYFYMGRSFTLKTMLAIVLLSLFSSMDSLLPVFTISPLIGAIGGGAIIGAGITALFKNGASFGGATILAIYLHNNYGINPGKINFTFDLLVVLTSLTAFSLTSGLYSALSIAVTSGVLSFYKKKRKRTELAKSETLPSTTSALQ
ncbi:YitT family protein [Paenibacillus sp. 2TAB23]|uniref:YitT family protein n=1 Tax=Paenibacillus sp. 2TAB23 TaxID=3233004 RepID=UPI003F953661